MHKSYIYEHFFDKFIIFCLFSFKYRKMHFSLYLNILWHTGAYSSILDLRFPSRIPGILHKKFLYFFSCFLHLHGKKSINPQILWINAFLFTQKFLRFCGFLILRHPSGLRRWMLHGRLLPGSECLRPGIL